MSLSVCVCVLALVFVVRGLGLGTVALSLIWGDLSTNQLGICYSTVIRLSFVESTNNTKLWKTHTMTHAANSKGEEEEEGG